MWTSKRSRILKFFTYKFIPTCYTFHTALVHMHAHNWRENNMWPHKKEYAKTSLKAHHQCSAPWSHPLSSVDWKAKILECPSSVFSTMSAQLSRADWKPKLWNAHHQLSVHFPTQLSRLVAQLWLCADCNMYKSTVAYAKTH
jgi:hypothetical protein